MKTVNGIIMQTKRMFAQLDKSAPDYSGKLHKIAEIGREYLHNIAVYYKMPYDPKTWAKIGDRKLPRAIYAGY